MFVGVHQNLEPCLSIILVSPLTFLTYFVLINLFDCVLINLLDSVLINLLKIAVVFSSGNSVVNFLSGKHNVQ